MAALLLAIAAPAPGAAAAQNGAPPEARPADSAAVAERRAPDAPPADTAHVYDGERVDVKAKLLNRPAVAEALARRTRLRERGLGGAATIRMVIDEQGRPTERRVVTRDGDAAVVEALLSATRWMRFTPARHGGRAVRVRIDVPMDFAPQP